LDLEIDSDLFDVLRLKIRSIVGIKHFGDTTQLPMWMALSPDRLSKGEGGSCRGGRIKAEEVSSNSPTVVIDDDGQPGLGDLTILSYQADAQLCMIGLPDRVWSRRFPSVNQVKFFAVRLSSTVGEGKQSNWEFTDEIVNEPVARWGLTDCLRKLPNLSPD